MILDIKICHQRVTMGSGDADTKLLCYSGMKGFPPPVFSALCAELPGQAIQLYKTNCNIWLRPNSPLGLVLKYIDNSSKYKIANNTKGFTAVIHFNNK